MPTQPPVAIAAQPPEGWVDKTMIVYAAAELGRAISPSIVIGRDVMGAAETFREFCNRQVETFRTTLPHFQREQEGEGRVHDLDAFRMTFTWNSAAGLLRQRVFFISAGAGVVVTFAASSGVEDFARHEQAFDQALSSLAIRSTETV